jgi:membrane protein
LSATNVTTSPQRLPSLWKLGGLTPSRLAYRVLRAIAQDDLFARASGLAFDFVLAIFPLMVFMLALFGLFASRGSQFLATLLSNFADLLPFEAAQLFDRVMDELASRSGGGKLTLGIVVGLWFASGGMSAMISTLNGVYRVREARSWFRVRATALGLTLVIAILLLSALLMVFVGNHFVDWMAAEFSWSSFLVTVWKDFRWPASAVFVMISFSLVYYCGPNLEQHRLHWITPGSLFGMLLWLASSVGLRVYLHFFNTYSATYGSLGAVMILLVWLYVTGLAFLIGGEINAEIERAAENISLPD